MTASYRLGPDAEDRLRTLLEARGCRIEADQTLDHEYKLDFVIHRFQGITRFSPAIGVQFTSRAGDLTKQEQFLRVLQATEVVPRGVYIELASDNVNLERGGAEIIYGALLAFSFGLQHREEKYVGLRIHPDYNFEFFDIECCTDELRRDEEAGIAGLAPGIEVTGQVVKYFPDKGYGFIKPDPGQAFLKDFFLLYKRCDARLLERITEHSKAPYFEPIRVIFRDGGITKEDVSARTALDIRLME